MIHWDHPNSYIFRYKVKKQKGKNYLEKRLAVPKKGCLNIKFLIIERWVQIAMWSVSRNVLHATESEYTSEEQPSICIDYNSLKIDHYHTIYFRKI